MPRLTRLRAMQVETVPIESPSKQAARRRRLIVLLSCALIAVGAVMLFVRLQNLLTAPSDFTQDYLAAQALRAGRSIYAGFTPDDLSAALGIDRQLQVTEPSENNHPPFNMLVFVPLTFLPYDAAVLLWSAVSALLFFLTGWIVVRELRIELARHWKLLLIGLGLCWFPFQAHIALGQLSLPVVACIVGGWALLRRRHDLAGGALLGAACLIKLFPGLIIAYILIQRRWRAGGAALETITAGGLLTLALVGQQDLIDYFVRVAPRDSAVHGLSPINVSLAGVIRRLFADGPWVSPLYAAPLLATVLVGLASLGVLFVLLRQIRRMPPTAGGDDRAYALVCLAMLLISPITWQHVFPLLLLPFGLLIQDLRAQPDRWRLGLCLLGLALVSLPDIEIARVLMGYSAPYRMPWFVGLPLVLPTAGLILLWWALVRQWQADPAYQGSSPT